MITNGSHITLALYYRSDHLGSAACLTNDAGNVSQTLNYLPYGEDWVDLKYSLDYRLGQYTFTGKERDEETGYGYFGARYMDHELMTMWLSVDPMADKYPSISPYAYCAWNPVKLVDPDGREIKFDPESEKLVNDFRERTEGLEKNMCTPEQRKQYKDALAELIKLEESDQLYHITDIGSTYDREKGGTYYKAEDNSICVEYDGKDGSLAHELKHAFQYETGKLSFKKDGSGFGELYDVTDEISALRRGGAWDKMQIETLRNVEYAYKFSVKNIPNIDFYYPFLDKAPNKHCLVGHRTTTRKVENAQSLGLDLSNDYYKMQ